jgi:hypothetical protein
VSNLRQTITITKGERNRDKIITYRIIIVSYRIVSPHSIFFPSPNGILGAEARAHRNHGTHRRSKRACQRRCPCPCVRAANFIAKTCVVVLCVHHRSVSFGQPPARLARRRSVFWTFAQKATSHRTRSHHHRAAYHYARLLQQTKRRPHYRPTRSATGRRSFYGACVPSRADSAARRSTIGAAWVLGDAAGRAARVSATHLGKVCGCAQAGELFRRIDTERPAVAFGPDGRLAVCGCDTREEVEAAVAEYKVSLCFYREVLGGYAHASARRADMRNIQEQRGE